MKAEDFDSAESLKEHVVGRNELLKFLEAEDVILEELEDTEFAYRFQLMTDTYIPLSKAQHESIKQAILDACPNISEEQVKVEVNNYAVSVRVDFKEKPAEPEFIPRNIDLMLSEIEYFAKVKRKEINIVEKDIRFLKFQITDEPGASTFEEQSKEYEKFKEELIGREGSVRSEDLEIVSDTYKGTFFIIDLDKSSDSE